MSSLTSLGKLPGTTSPYSPQDDSSAGAADAGAGSAGAASAGAEASTTSSVAQNTLSQALKTSSPPSPIATKWLQITKQHEIIAEQKIFQEQQRVFREYQALKQQILIKQPEVIFKLKNSFEKVLNLSPQQQPQQVKDSNSIEESTVSTLEAGKKYLFVDHRFSDAIYCFKLGLKNTELHPEFRATDETNALLSFYLASAFIQIGELTKASIAYQNALTFPNSNIWTKAIICGYSGDLYEQRKETSLAIKAYQCALLFKHPHHEFNAIWSHRLGVIYARQDQKQEALAEFKNGLNFSGATAETRLRLLTSFRDVLERRRSI